VQAPQEQGNSTHQVKKNNASHQLLSLHCFGGRTASHASK
jgi:hypothetical protein